MIQQLGSGLHRTRPIATAFILNKDDSNVYIKLVNPDKSMKTIELDFANLNLQGRAEITALTGSLNTANAIGNEQIAPTTATQEITDGKLSYDLPRYSVNVIRVPLNAAPTVSKESLKALVQEVSSLKQSDYTTASWTRFAQALKNAQDILAKD